MRWLRRSPGFALAAVLILAPAIGGATAMFSIVDAVIVRGLPYRDAGRLQAVYESSDNGNLRTPSYPTVRDWQAQIGDANPAIEGVSFIRGNGVSVLGPGGPEQRIVAYVDSEFFSLTGARPLAGRALAADDYRFDAPQIAVASFDFFQHQFNGDRSAIGRTVVIDSMPTTIIGVMPPGFAYPNFGSGGWLPPAIWEPITAFQRTNQALSLRGLHVDSRTILRVRAGSDSARVTSTLHTIEQRLAAEYPAEQGHWTSVQLAGLSEELFGRFRSTLVLISGAVGLLLLLACANIANLLLVRVSSRDREMAIRAALGAGSWRLTRLVVADAVAIATAGGAVGLALAHVALSFVRSYAGARLPFATQFAIDARAASFVFVAAAGSALFLAIVPLLHRGHGRLAERLRGGSSSTTSGTAGRRVRGVLVSLQLALTIAVLIGAGLLVQSVRRLAAIDLGYDPRGLISFTIAPASHRYDEPADAAALYKRIIEAVRAVPGVDLAAAAGGALLPTKVETEEQRGAATPPTAAYHPISADYLGVLRLRIVAGRAFTDDDMRSPNGFLVTENLAKHLWPGTTAIGKRITVYRSSQARVDFGQPMTLPVVGVVSDYRAFGPDQNAPEQVFLPYTLEVWPWMNFVVRSSRSGQTLGAVTKAVQSVDPAIKFRGSPSLERTGPSFADPRFFVMTLMSAFAATALVLSAIGLYAVVAFGASQRTRELGIRIAVGATQRRILWFVASDAGVFVAVGTIAGLLVASMTTRVLRAMLFETAPSDLTTFIVVPFLLAGVAAIAAVIPAYRAARIDPLVALRAE
jgi:putative ABC transport system permease protein